MTRPTEVIEGCASAQAGLLAQIEGLDDETARRPSLLPGWRVGHVLTHLARNADSVVRRLEGAQRGEVVDQYPGGYAGRAADIEAGAGRGAAELVEDVARSAAAVDAVAAGLDDAAWERPTRDVSGAEKPARAVLLSRWREVEVHRSDLGLGHPPSAWPPALVAAWLDDELERLPARTDPSALLAWIIGRGPAPAVEAW